ncbi:phospholipid-transporting ATPase ABCA3-like [Crassostrea angulata]|uniref:phospholipid-transporting ATPase ABCA3-like n=1 Tax=Magallana angulata TaxID=2784310 RepID=UPI0022B1FA4D|nr:phospholipid-transporting ATPase ABCA3-like [Crassostrea angulata]XP_052680752.1 phospholipid-transporting ATPase ABCA3-like [Crassostrea angulata]XP_052680753.1 phospholipid-transporting ATPase ABCA3-like [Crassostrea angulata]
MVAGLFTQFLLLTWKNILLQRRKLCVTVFEIVLPLVFPIVLIVIRNLSDFKPQLKNATIYEANPIGFEYWSYNEVLYAPNTTLITKVMNNTRQILKERSRFPSDLSMKGFATEVDILNYYQNISVWNRFSKVAVVFDPSHSNDSVLPDDVTYKIRMDGQWSTKSKYFDHDSYQGPRRFQPYFDYGFLILMFGIDTAIIKHFSPSATMMNITTMRMPYPPYYTYQLGIFIKYSVAVTLVLGLVLPTLQLTKEIVHDREKKLKETLRMMGLSSFVYWFSWFFKGVIFLTVTFAITVIIIQSGSAKIFDFSDSSLIFFFYLSYGVSVVAFSFLFSSFFNKANTASYFCAFVYFITVTPHFGLITKYADLTKSQRMALCLLNNMAMATGFSSITEYEAIGKGVQWNTFTKPPTVDGTFTFGDAILMLWIDSAIYFLLTWYIDGVRPGEYGVPQPFYFPFTKTYWCGGEKIQKMSSEETSRDPKFFESDPHGLNVGISMNNLRKVFKSDMKEVVAVKGTTLDIFQGQITALLGHNGAGKTTTMSMLTGFIPSTSGSARVNGYDINTDISSVRGSLGLCPQHNTLFDNLTVKQQLEFHFKLKGCNRNTLDNDISETLKAFRLQEKQNDLARTLSGGQKRKLSVAIALIGGSKVIILDEPTSGMDPGARRQMWNILQKYKEGRTIVLSTHFMDEADVLGDRIAIMADGEIKCCGSSLFLKKLYGAGYHLVIVKARNCDIDCMMGIIHKHIPKASVEMEVGAEVSVLLPTEETANFEALFSELEENGSHIGVGSFGLSATTMEEVFLKVKDDRIGERVDIRHEQDERDVPHVPLDIDDDVPLLQHLVDVNVDIEFNRGVEKNTGIRVVLQQVYGLLVKKALHTWRSKVMILFQLIVPILLGLCGLLADQSISQLTFDIEPPLTLNLDPYPDTTTTISAGPRPTETAKNLTEAFSQWFEKRGLNVIEYNPKPPLKFNISEFWLDKIKDMGKRTFRSHYLIGFGVNGSDVVSYYNGDAIHSAGISLVNTMNFLLKLHCGKSKNIQTINHPMPDSYYVEYDTGLEMFKGLGIAECVLFGLSCLVASFCVFHIRERSSGAKHLQKVSGVSSIVFWMANLIWDMLHYLVPIVFILVCFAAYKIPAYVDEGRLGLLFFCFLMFGFASISFMYLLQFLFRSPAGGTVVIIIINIVVGLFTLLTVTFLYPVKETSDSAVKMDNVFMVFFPHYCLGKSIINIYVRYAKRLKCLHPNKHDHPSLTFFGGSDEKCPDSDYLELDYPGCGKYLCMMALQFVVYMTLVFMIDSGVIQRLVYRALCNKHSITDPDNVMVQDSDVIEEENRVNSTQISALMNTDKLIIKNLRKTFGTLNRFEAVKDISVGISAQECFGLLGQNGAGKTTTFKMLTGDVMISTGRAYVNGYCVDSQLNEVHRCLGYCPQFDALIESMTGREILTLYARLRGVREDEITRVIDDLLEAVTLKQYANKLCGTYSGGNKRKLSTAIALVGDPPFLMLDEPTTGVDPAARRQIWTVLSKIRASGRTLVLTSHSMEECDALCTKIVIMVNGKFVCFGSPQHLKNKFAQGYTLTIRLARNESGNAVNSGPIRNFLFGEFPGTEVFEDQQGYLDFQIPNQNLSLAKLFREMERTKSEFGVADYSVHQTSLEQVFLSFTRKQVPPKEKKGSCSCCFCCRSKPGFAGQIIRSPAMAAY